MRKLLSANFARLWSSKSFWVTLAALFGFSLVQALNATRMVQNLLELGYERVVDRYMFNEAPYMGIFQGVFISFFLGTEYSDGTVRNKLVVGHRRGEIFLANFIVCFAASCVFLAAWWVAMTPYVAGLGMPEMGAKGLALYALVAVGFTAVFAALYTSLASLSSSKAVTLVLALVLWIGLLYTGNRLVDRLWEPEMKGGMAYINGAVVETGPVPNPLYLTGAARAVCEFLRDLLPTSQAILMTDAELTRPLPCAALSAVLTVCICILGAAAFRRKDIK